MTSEENTNEDLSIKNENILNHTLNKEMKTSYINYAMSVIIGRALPDVRDGLKPVHRRVLYGMYEGGHTSDRKYSKSERSVGEVMGKYHPHLYFLQMSRFVTSLAYFSINALRSGTSSPINISNSLSVSSAS